MDLIGRDLPLKIHFISVIGQIINKAAFLLSLQCRQVASGYVSSAEIASKYMKNCRKKLLMPESLENKKRQSF